MHTTTSLIALLSAATTISALPATTLSPRSAGQFSISGFCDHGVPHETQATVSFSVTDLTAGTPLNDVLCSTTLPAIQPTIATAPFGTACSTPSLVFGFTTVATGGYNLTLQHHYDGQTTDTGIFYFPTAKVETYENPANPNGDYEFLARADALTAQVWADFEVPYTRVQG